MTQETGQRCCESDPEQDRERSDALAGCDGGASPPRRSKIKTLLAGIVLLAAIGIGTYSLAKSLGASEGGAAASRAAPAQSSAVIQPGAPPRPAEQQACCGGDTAPEVPARPACCGGGQNEGAPARPRCGGGGDVELFPASVPAEEPSCGAPRKSCCGQ
jgi:hypothetical protein